MRANFVGSGIPRAAATPMLATLNNMGAIRQAARPPGPAGWRDLASTIAHSQDLLGHAWAIDLLGHAWAIAGHLGPAAAKKVADKLAALALEKLPQQPCQPAEPADQPVPRPATDDQLPARLQAVFGPVADMLRDLRKRTFTDPPK